MVTKVSMHMISPTTAAAGSVVAEGKALSVQPDLTAGQSVTGVFDPVMGITTISIPGYEPIHIRGYPTLSSMGTGRQGLPGFDGSPGVDGLLGAEGIQGPRGCRGPQGPQGKPGVRGPRGIEGPIGPTGSTGPQGIRGQDGRVQIYIQAEDPGAVGAGALWIATK